MAENDNDRKKKTLDFLSEQFKEEIAEEKARRENIDMKEMEDLAAKIRKKGSLRE